MVATTSGGEAAAGAAVAALQNGGSAADAVLIAALMQIVLSAGCWVSLAGVLSLLYYDATDSGEVQSLNAGFNTVQNELDPLSIPGTGSTSGRTVLVPGFMAGLQMAHDRFGKLPFTDLFTPAIHLAETGFVLSRAMAQLIGFRHAELMRHPEGREIFFSPEHNRLYSAGDLFRQPRLAATLRCIAAQGADYMQRGEWAHRFVHSVAQAGGKLRSADLEAYCADWTSPVRADYRGCQVIAPGLPALGGVNTVEAVRLLDRLPVSRGLHSTSSADALFWLIQTTRALWLGPPLPPERRLDPRTTDVLWQEMQRSGGLTYAGHTRMRKALSHSDAVVAVDEHGNVAALCHSINTLAWGTTGLFVDGVSIPDSASFQQQEIARAGRGNRLPDAMNPVVVTRSGKPVFTSASIGSSLHEITIQGLVNVLDLEMPAGAAACAPNFWMPLPTPVDAALDGSNRFFRPIGDWLRRLLVAACVRVGRPRWVLNPPQAVEPTGFNKELLEAVSARGLQLVEGDHAALLGHWVAIQQTAPGSPGRLEGAATTRGAATDAEVRGY